MRQRAWPRLGPRLAARLRLGLTGDAIGLELDGEGHMVALKPAFGGNIVAPILSKTHPQMATVRQGVLQLVEPNPRREAWVLREGRRVVRGAGGRRAGADDRPGRTTLITRVNTQPPMRNIRNGVDHIIQRSLALLRESWPE